MEFMDYDCGSDESDCEYDTKPVQNVLVELVEIAAAATIKKPSTKTLTETFNQHKLNYLIQHEEKYTAMMTQKDKSDYNPMTIAKKYLNKSINGKILVKYFQQKGVGRFHASGSVSMQCLPRKIRHTIADGYTDIDIVNAHPIILYHLCKQRALRTPHLKFYIKNREECLKSLEINKLSREDAKHLIISMINGGEKDYESLSNQPKWLVSLKDEIYTIHNHFTLDKEYKTYARANKKETNKEASYMNIQLCDFENKILICIYDKLGKPSDCVLCFDGLMVRTDYLETSNYKLSNLEAAVFELLDIKINLKIKEMNEALPIPDEIPNYNSFSLLTNSFNFDDSINYKLFQNKFKEYEADTWEEIHEALGDEYPKVINRILSGEGSYIKKLKDGKTEIVKKLGASDFNIFVDGKKYKFSDYLIKQNGLGDYVCKLENYPTDDFNLWSGFQAKQTTNKPEGLELIKTFIYEVWASSNQTYYDYIISWFAGLVSNLSGLNEVALSMIAEQGTGKGFLLTFMRLILRDINVCEVAGIQSITQKHNTCLQNKRLVCINEMSSTKDEFKANFDKIKMLITDTHLQIEPKGVNPYEIDNISNFLLFSNHRDAIIIEEEDRRYATFEMSNCHKGDHDYFNNLADKCFNQETADAFYTYLLEFPAVELKNIPDTELRAEMINLSKPTPLKFYAAIYEDEIYEIGEQIQATELYNKYVNWCQANGERSIYTNTKFGTTISRKLSKSRSGKGKYYII
jgi:hypothetical protein